MTRMNAGGPARHLAAGPAPGKTRKRSGPKERPGTPEAIRPRAASRLLLAFAAVAGLGAMQAPALTFNPKHFENNDPLWALFNETHVTPDKARGVYVASFPPRLAAGEGGPLRVAGFILPLEASPSSRHFMLVRRNTGCPFCPPNAPTEAVEVLAQEPVSYTGEEVRMSGRLRLVPSSGDGLFFRLEGATLAR